MLTMPEVPFQLQTNAKRVPTIASTGQASLERKANEKTLRQNLLSTAFLMFLFWYTLLYVRIQMFVVSFNAWITDFTGGDEQAGRCLGGNVGIICSIYYIYIYYI